jgi:hypothetical protein
MWDIVQHKDPVDPPTIETVRDIAKQLAMKVTH